MSRFIRASALAPSVLCFIAPPAQAHGFGQRYDLPLPLSLYLAGTAAAIVFSFVVVSLFVRRAAPAHGYPSVSLLAHRPGNGIAWRAIASTLGALAVLLFVVTVLAGFKGNQDPYRNIAPTLVWIIAWVGLAYVSAFVGNVWILVNPWRTLFVWAQSVYKRAGGKGELSLHLAYPEALGIWPAFALFAALSWIELVYPSPALPAHIAWMIVGYSILTWTGMAVFGLESWLRHGEVFTVFFGVLARFAPTEVRANELALRPCAAGLLDSTAVTPSMATFVLLILSCVLYDGALATPQWAAFESAIAARVTIPEGLARMVIRTVGMVGSWLLFFGAYLGVAALMSALVAARRSTWEVARIFALTLVPIAIAYHLAHYLTYLLTQGQYIVPLLSDPLGYGWNLFGTAAYRVDIGLVGARFEWYTAVAAIVVGHIVAVYLAHRRAIQVFEGRGAALRSQVPLTALMVAYTFVSLSILAEPITERTSHAPEEAAQHGISIPADAVLPIPGDGRLQRAGAGKLVRQKLVYRVLGSAFQDGSRMGVADILYAYMFAYRWGARSSAATDHYDPFVDAATATLRERLAALRFIGTDTASKSFRVGEVDIVRELLVIEIYTSISSEDAERDATIAPPWSAIPWHLLVLMEEAVGRGWAAFSEAEAAKRGVDWLDLARSERMNRQLLSLVETFERDGYRPEALRSLVSAEAARKRWAALAAFYKNRGHFLVTDGPYQLKRWGPNGVSLDVFRDLSYPLGVGSYDAYAIPRRAFITRTEQAGGRMKFFGEVETVMKFQRSYELTRHPLQALDREDLKSAALECRYMVLDAASRVVLTGLANPANDGSFGLDLNGRLPAGSYTMLAEITVNRNAANAEIWRGPMTIPAKP